jgi:flagella basal body P-ring formation protein FlgA
MKTLLTILLAIEPAFCGCIKLNGEEIRAHDLAPFVVAFGTADPDTIVGLSPSPGVRRLMSFRDLTLAAQGARIEARDIPAAGVCLERALREVSEHDLITAMADAFSGRPVKITVVDSSRYAVPEGRLLFQLTGLNAPPPSQPDSPVLWRGRVMYAGTRSMEIWAKVQISTATRSCMALTSIPAGTPIEAEQIRIVESRRFPLRSGETISDISAVVGLISRRPILAGQEITMKALDRPPEVRAGDTVHVSAAIGNARVALDALAASSGREGESIVLKNPSSHVSFKAVIQGRGRAVVNTGHEGRP